MRYNRDDYSACDWRVTKSDILRSRKAIAHKRRVNLANVLGVILLLVVIVVTLDGLFKLYS